jgi:transposase InsO family protein
VKGQSGGDKGTNKPKPINLCTICGGKHDGECLFKTHPNANHEKVPYRESTQGKAYLAAFASKGYEKLRTDVLGGERWKMPKKSGNTIHYHSSDIQDLCQECTSCTSCKTFSLNNIDIPFDNQSDDHLLLSYIKVSNSDEPLLIKAFLDWGSLQEDGNYISVNLFNRLRNHKNIVIVNKKSKTCNEILNACISTNVEIKILWYYHNVLTDTTENATLTCKVVKSPYDLIIGRVSIMQHQLLAKCHQHFNIDIRLFRTLTNSGRGKEFDHQQIPVNYLNLIDDNSQFAFPSTSAELPGFRKDGSILKKSDLLSRNPSLEDNIEFINEELPQIDDTIKDETELISFEFTGENEAFNAEALKIFKTFKDVISTTLRTEPARIEPMKLKVDDSKWKINANRLPPRMISREKEAALNKQIEDYLAQHVVEPSIAPYWSQVLMTPKPHVDSNAPLEKKFRFCVDERNLNRATESSGGHIPNIKFMIQRIGLKRPKYFCKIDLTTGFFQAPVSKDSREYLTFTTNRGNYQFLRVPMGCKNSPAYFQNQLANMVLTGLLYHICELYIDDVLVFGNTPAELLRNVTKVLERFRKHNIIANPKKIRCGMSQIEHTGYLLNENGFTFSREKLDMVEDFDRPVLVKELKSFLGLANHFRSVVQNHSLLAGPLDKLCANYQSTRYNKVKWTPETIASFNELKSKIVNCPSMYFLQDNLPIFLATDASKYLGYGAYLYQKDPQTNQEFPVAFISKSWQGAQVNWSTPDQEAFAIYDAFKRLHYLIRDVKFTLLTDHANLTYVNFEGSDKIQRYKAEMLQYDFDILHVKGKDNLVPDILSRLRREPQSLHQLNLLEEANGLTGDDLLVDKELSDPSGPMFLDEDVAHNGFNENEDDEDWFLQSQSFSKKALRHLHDAHGQLAGHGGVDRTYATLMTRDPEYWTKRKHLVKRYVRRCYFCQKMAMVKHQIHSSPFTTSSHKLFEKVCMDYIGPLPPDREGNRYILVIVDSFSRYVNLYASQSNTANECALALLDFTSTFGNPTVLFSDRGTHFANNIITELTKLMNSSQQFTAPYSSEENGLCERVNKEVLRHLRGIIFDKSFKYDWGRADLPLVKRIINNIPHSRLGTTPNSLVLPSVDLNKNMFGHRRAMSEISNIPIPKHSKTLRHSNDGDDNHFDFKYFLQHMQNRQELILELVKQRIQQFDENRIGNYPSDRTEFPIGSYVLLKPKPDAKFGIADKLHTPLKGPFKVLGHDKNTYQIQNLTNNIIIPSVNIQRLQPFYVNEVEDDPRDISNKDSDSFIIERVISHSPPKPTRVTELCFRIKWLGWNDENSNTTECWLANPDLKINKVVLRYMNSIPHLRKFVNKNINLDSDDEQE